ncbi:MAG: RelA/SpoT family protein [Bacteroidia bacterium]|nr:RelA/SpoT family protein [Bacteroidia bacterium]
MPTTKNAEVEVDYEKLILRAYRHIIRPMRNTSRSEKAIIRKAFEMARDAHEGVKRKSGEPYILHPLAVAKIVVVEMGLEDTTSVVCALLHDTVEDTNMELADIKREFGNKAMAIIDGLTKISGTALDQIEISSKQAENFRKILLTISDDVRVVMIKLADRLHNMRTLGSMRQEKMLKIASETLYIYAPLAHRLGLYEIKTELEDLCFKFMEPAKYDRIKRKLEAIRTEDQNYIDRFMKGIKKALIPLDIDFMVKSRFKSIYSVYSKMIRKELPFEEIYDKYAIRIILETREGHEREDCWFVYSLISGIFQPNPKRLRDWITVPKDNGYESLHTTLMGPEGKWVEVQIRTERMDDIAEKGIAAHWKYKDDGEQQEEFITEWIGQIRNILQNPSLNALEAVREFKDNLQPNDVYVFTPKGELIRLPIHSTVLDFAYKIHSKIGHEAIGAKINNKVVSLDSEVRPGDQVEIITSKKQKPKKDWLRYVRTAKARDQIRLALRKERQEFVDQGRQLFLWKSRQYGVDEKHPMIKELLSYFKYPNIEELFYAIGTHKIDTKRIPEFIELKKAGKELDTSEWERLQKDHDDKWQAIGVDTDTLLLGKEQSIDNYGLGTCCGPLPGDDIIGLEENNRIVIHRTSCEEAVSFMSNYGSKIVKAKWASKSDVSFLAAIKVVGLDKQGMLNDIIRIISLRMKLNIRKVTIDAEDGMFEGVFHIYVRNIDELTQVMQKIENLKNVYTASRYEEDQKE